MLIDIVPSVIGLGIRMIYFLTWDKSESIVWVDVFSSFHFYFVG